MVNRYKTDDPSCAVVKYQAVIDDQEEITQDNCESPDGSDDCMKIDLKTDKAGDFKLKFLVSARGGASIESEDIILTVCEVILDDDLVTNF